MSDETIMNVEQMARAVYGLDADSVPSKSQRNRIREMCREGKVPAIKCGRRWVVKLEWPDAAE